eukprot:CAMPEP_0197177616 /NCGR_PEP_ID=MMETSP1423-20130617/3163_1 /TAXON_ID=476441 /ORGANISM="Pseudo-nitzschia heimii, Strain UNC1101" /LENGTH=287 /DNA_ID=CAMNT_0042627191 /DNA_START=111 /DNA_END=974 /DNA_ORIENTATION=+
MHSNGATAATADRAGANGRGGKMTHPEASSSSSRRIFRTALSLPLLLVVVLSMRADAWSVSVGSPIGRVVRTTETAAAVTPLRFSRGDDDDDLRRRRRHHRPSSVLLRESPSDAATASAEEESRGVVRISDLNDMDVVVYSLPGGEGNDDDDGDEELRLGALQEDGVLSPLSAWTDEFAFGESIELLVDEEDRFALRQRTSDQREAEGTIVDGDADGDTRDDDDDDHPIRIHHLLSEEEVSYGQRQCARGVHNPHGEESELLYYVDQRIIDRFGIGMELKPELETLF